MGGNKDVLKTETLSSVNVGMVEKLGLLPLQEIALRFSGFLGISGGLSWDQDEFSLELCPSF